MSVDSQWTRRENIRISTTPTFGAYLRLVLWMTFRQVQVRLLIWFAVFALIV